MLAPITNRSRNLAATLSRWIGPTRTRWTPIMPEPSPAVYYTRGDDLLSPGDYRRSLNHDLQLSVSGTANVDDTTAARIYATSATANACIEKRATLAASIPLKVVDENGDDLEDTELTYFVSNTAYMVANAVRSSLIWGRSYFRKRYNAEGYPTGLEWINPQRVREKPDDDGNIAEYGIRIITYWGLGAEEIVPAKDIIYWQVFDTDPSGQGVSKLEAAFRSISIEFGIATHAAAFFLNRAAIDGILTFDRSLNDDERKQAEAVWLKFKGAKNAHRTAVMPGGATWTPVSVPPKDLAMGELDDKQVKKIHAVIEIDTTLTGMEATSDPLGASSTFEAKEIAHLRDVAVPFLTTYILSALNDQWALTDFSQPYTLAVDTANIAAYADANLLKSETAIALSNDVVTDIDESRELIGLPPRGSNYLQRSPKDASVLWNDGAIEMNEYRWLVGLPKVVGGDVRLIGGNLIPTPRLPEVANKMADGIGQPAPSPFGAFAPPGEPVTISKPEAPALPAPPVESEPVAKVDTLPPETSRSSQPLELALSFAGNAFIRYCRRALSEALTAQGIEAQWVSENDWRLTLARADTWTPAAASNIIKASNYADTRPLDFVTDAFESIPNNGIYLALTGDLSGLARSAGLDMEGANLNAATRDFAGVLLCTLSSDKDIPELPTAEKYPLVGNTVSLLKGSEPLHSWTLSGVSAARSKELQHWRTIAKDGRDFTPNVLRDSAVAAFIADTLAADVEVDDVFDLAREMLRGLYTWRAYPETREDFIRELTTLFKAGQADEIQRRAFAARLRTLLRRFGLLAFHDGMAEAGGDHDSLSADELKTFRAWQDEQSGYVTNLGAEIFREGISEAEAINKVYMWADVSLGKIKILGTIAGGDPMLRRVLGQVESKHCPECLRLAGQIHKASEWAERDLLIGTSLTTCKQGCHCSYVVTDEDESGDWL